MDMILIIQKLATNYRKADLIANTDVTYINYSINSGYSYKSDENGNYRKFIELSFIEIF